MNKDNSYCVYMHICPNNKKYIGMTKDIKARWQYGNGYRDNIDFYESIKLYNWKNIEHLIIADSLTKEEAEELEEQLILEHKTYDSNYGYNKYIGNKWTEERKNEYSEKFSGENAYWYGKTLSEEAKRKMSNSRSGELNPMYGRKRKGKDNPHAKKVICTTTNKIFNCIIDGANYYGANKGNISACCRGKRKSAGKLSDGTKLVWRYLYTIEL